ncbi:hypothetical protein LB504_005816 [Fusarium proliferatum]|nr:hypothetical protein LB504_005816 [Fusarium proliferatum]
MDDLNTRRHFLLEELAEIDDTIAVYRQLAGENGDVVNADTVDPTLPSRGDDYDDNHENGNNHIEDDRQIAFDFDGEMMEIFPERPGSPSLTSDDDDVEIITSSRQEPSKLSLRDTPLVVLDRGPSQDPRFKPDQWLSEKPNESFSRDFLQGIGTQRLCNTLRPEISVIMLAHPYAEGCPANKACYHWELRWDDRPRRDPGTLELELICLDRRDRGDYIDPPGKKFYMLDEDHPRPIKCNPCFLFNGLKPDFSCLDGTNLDVVLFRMLQPDDGEDDDPVEGYMDRCGRQLATLLYE